MFSLFKKYPKNLSSLRVDMHSHLIPGIDDGSKSLEKSMEYIRKLADLGIEKIITTPHIMGEYYPNTPEIILSGAEKVRTEIKKHGLNIEFSAAAEYYADDYFYALLDKNAPLLTLKDNLLLFEFSTFAPPPDPLGLIFRLKTLGYTPVLAHPERYVYYTDKYSVFSQMKERGCLLQVNLLSLVGHYGQFQKRLASRLLADGCIDYAGTDLHHGGHTELILKSLNNNRLGKYLDKYNFRNSSL